MTADLRQFTLDRGRYPSLLAGEEHPESLVGKDARDGAADQRLHVRDHGFQGVAIIGLSTL
jgi:hypothetical protein